MQAVSSEKILDQMEDGGRWTIKLKQRVSGRWFHSKLTTQNNYEQELIIELSTTYTSKSNYINA